MRVLAIFLAAALAAWDGCYEPRRIRLDSYCIDTPVGCQ